MKFTDIKLSENLHKALLEIGFVKPTEIQKKTIPFLLNSKKDLIALAQTGTGKTAAFSIPVIESINIKKNQTQSIILCPTRELCIQIKNDIDILAKYKKIKINSVYGGTDIKTQIKSLDKGNHIIVGTPGRVIDLIKRKKINLEKIKILIMDEADEMLNMGFKESIDTILEKTPSKKQTLLFSATMPSEVLKISKNYMNDPDMIEVANRNEGAKNIQHYNYLINNRQKYSALKRLCDFNPNIYGIIFCRTRRECKDVASKLMSDGYNADSLHGDLSQSQRDYVMKKFREKNLEILVATDVAARGLDVNNITHIINYNLPDEIEIYVHRSGRTGRANKKGISIILSSNRDAKKINAIEKMIKKDIVPKTIPSGAMICEKQLLNLIDKVVQSNVDKQIEEYLPIILEKLKSFDKEQIIKHFVSVEFNRFLKFYKTETDFSIKSIDQNRKTIRYHLNIGKKNGLGAQHILGLINEKIKQRDLLIGKIEILKNFSFVEIDQRYESEIETKLNNIKWKGVNLKIEKAKDKESFKKKGGKKYKFRRKK